MGSQVNSFMVNQVVTHIANELKIASKKNDAPIWLKLAKTALKSNSIKKLSILKKLMRIRMMVMQLLFQEKY